MIILPASFWSLIILQVLFFRIISITFPVSSEQMSFIPWHDEILWSPKSHQHLCLLLWLLLTNHPWVCMKCCWLDISFLTTAFFMLLLLTFPVTSVKASVCHFQAVLEIGWVIFSMLVSFLAALGPWPINDTPKQIKD